VLSLNDKKGLKKNRHGLDIVREVLSIASVKVRKTRIMYGANLSFVQVERYLRLLLGSGLLEHDGDYSYLVTGTGIEFLQLYSDYLERSTRLKEDVERNTRDRLRLEKMCFNEACKTENGKEDF
jgi:predicted transcriptional regulator